VAVRRMGQASGLRDEFEKAGALGDSAKNFWLRALITVSGSTYLAVAAYGLWKYDMVLCQRALGLAALATMILLGLGSYALAQRLLGSATVCSRKSFTVAGGVLLIGWIFSFLFCLVPPCEFGIGGLVVALLWALAPTGVISGASLALEERTDKKETNPPSGKALADALR
jgi:hypothetical protein